MSLLAYNKKVRDEIEKLIEDHVKKSRRNYPWSGEHKEVTKKIMNIFRRISQCTRKKLEIIAESPCFSAFFFVALPVNNERNNNKRKNGYG